MYEKGFFKGLRSFISYQGMCAEKATHTNYLMISSKKMLCVWYVCVLSSFQNVSLALYRSVLMYLYAYSSHVWDIFIYILIVDGWKINARIGKCIKVVAVSRRTNNKAIYAAKNKTKALPQNILYKRTHTLWRV